LHKYQLGCVVRGFGSGEKMLTRPGQGKPKIQQIFVTYPGRRAGGGNHALFLFGVPPSGGLDEICRFAA